MDQWLLQGVGVKEQSEKLGGRKGIAKREIVEYCTGFGPGEGGGGGVTIRLSPNLDVKPPLRMRTKTVSIFIFFQELSNKTKKKLRLYDQR